MSLQQTKFCSLVVRELFGPVAEGVATILLKSSCTLRLIQVPDVSRSKVKAALLALIHHNLVTFELDRTFVVYTFRPEGVLALVRAPRYLQVVRDEFSEMHETLVEEVINCGRTTLSNALFRAGCRVHAADPATLSVSDLHGHFLALARAGYLNRCPVVLDPEAYLKPGSGGAEELVPATVDVGGAGAGDAVPYSATAPEMDVGLVQERIVAGAEDEGDQKDKHVLWRVNAKRFDIQLRDALVVDAAFRRSDEFGGALVRAMLSQQASHPSTHGDALAGDICLFVLKSDMAKLGLKSLVERMRDYLEVLQSGSLKILRKIGDSGGGQFAVAVKDTIDALTAHAVRCVVRERHGTKAARVFALMLDRVFVDQEQIQDAALIPAKEAKVLTYLLTENHFASVREIRKSMGGGAAGVKSVYLFTVDLPQVVRGLVERCYKSLGNILSRKETEVADHERLMEKKARVDAMLKALSDQGADAEQLEAVAGLITPPERDLVVKVNYLLDRLSGAELEVESTLFLFQMYLFFDEKAKKERVAGRGRGRGKRAKT